eukprot:TRINITY_DN95287_c0_g1_i1.p1 TRINITY_DN95287_c0_g1~~TRINITY_DN95287_c0_g1_i1.p1  ORF type:complete len:120 (-),score=1.31 TRINITY_DN95287_c0_g1_i1:103-462(-)
MIASPTNARCETECGDPLVSSESLSWKCHGCLRMLTAVSKPSLSCVGRCQIEVVLYPAITRTAFTKQREARKTQQYLEVHRRQAYTAYFAYASVILFASFACQPLALYRSLTEVYCVRS